MNTEITADIPRVYAAVAETLACMIYIGPLQKRFAKVPFIAGLLSCGVCIGLVHYIGGFFPVSLWIPSMLAAVGAMYLCIFVYADISWLDAGYYCARAFILAELAASVAWQIYYFAAEEYFGDSIQLRIIIITVIYMLAFGAMYVLESRRAPKTGRLGASRKELGSAILIAIAAFLISNISFAFRNTPFSSTLQSSIMYIRTLVDFSGLVMLYAQHEQRQENRLRHELDAINNVLHRQYEQYQMTKESIDIINRKYHDLKHQISVIRAESDPEKRESYLAEMDHAIMIYEVQNKTGNSVVDTILSSKYMSCAEKEISFTCVVDGKLLDFMDVMDVCTILGNALDNAIEHVEKLKDPEKRLIKMAVYSQNDFIMLCFENYIEETITFVDGIPKTTKKDFAFHGYGIKSMVHSAEKYGGNLTIKIEDNWFIVRILIPAQGE